MNLLIIILGALIFIVIAIAKFKIHPFITLILAAITVGFLMGLEGVVILDKISAVSYTHLTLPTTPYV